MPFKNVIAQNEVKQHLVELVQHNRLGHALLFLGPEGSGALPLRKSKWHSTIFSSNIHVWG